MKSPILGGQGQARSRNLADNQCWNLFQSIVETRDGKDVGALYMAPGLDLKATVGNGPIRAARVVGSLLYVVSGTGIYSVTTAWASTLLGSVGTSSGPVSIIDNGPFGQIAFFDGAAGYLWNSKTSTFSTLTLPFSGPVQATYQDTFGLVYANNTQQWYSSSAGDLSVWSALAFSSADASPDNVKAIISIHREVWVMKAQHTEVWVDAGASPFAFSRLDGVFLQQGCAASFTVAIGGEALFWLAANDQGQGRVVMARGYQASTISSVAMEYELSQYSTISDAIGYCYEQEGELFYVLTFPTANVTWCYSVRAGLWHKRGAFVNGAWNRHWSNCYAYFNGYCLVGDYRNGNLYAFNLDNATDNGSQRVWLRTWRALQRGVLKPARFSALTIDMETGMQVTQGANPQAMLRWSDDGGHTWSNQIFAPVGQSGQTTIRVIFRRLGSTKRNRGLDRIFELSSSDPFKVALIGAEIE